MTDAEDEHNAFLNSLIQTCQHESIRRDEAGALCCGRCSARFAVVLFPRRAKPLVFIPEDCDD